MTTKTGCPFCSFSVYHRLLVINRQKGRASEAVKSKIKKKVPFFATKWLHEKNFLVEIFSFFLRTASKEKEKSHAFLSSFIVTMMRSKQECGLVPNKNPIHVVPEITILKNKIFQRKKGTEKTSRNFSNCLFLRHCARVRKKSENSSCNTNYFFSGAQSDIKNKGSRILFARKTFHSKIPFLNKTFALMCDSFYPTFSDIKSCFQTQICL